MEIQLDLAGGVIGKRIKPPSIEWINSLRVGDEVAVCGGLGKYVYLVPCPSKIIEIGEEIRLNDGVRKDFKVEVTGSPSVPFFSNLRPFVGVVRETMERHKYRSFFEKVDLNRFSTAALREAYFRLKSETGD